MASIEALPNNAKEPENNGDEDQAKKPQKVPILKLFAFADTYDYFLMAVGSLGACIHGASVPVFFIFFGKLINTIGIAYLFPTLVSHKVASGCAVGKFERTEVKNEGLPPAMQRCRDGQRPKAVNPSSSATANEF